MAERMLPNPDKIDDDEVYLRALIKSLPVAATNFTRRKDLARESIQAHGRLRHIYDHTPITPHSPFEKLLIEANTSLLEHGFGVKPGKTHEQRIQETADLLGLDSKHVETVVDTYYRT